MWACAIWLALCPTPLTNSGRPLGTATDRGEAYAWTELARPEAVVRMGRQLTEPEPPVVAAAVNDGGARASGSDEGVSPPPTTPAESGSGEPSESK